MNGFFKIKRRRTLDKMSVNRLEIDLNKLEYNLKQIKQCMGKEIELLPVIK